MSSVVAWRLVCFQMYSAHFGQMDRKDAEESLDEWFEYIESMVNKNLKVRNG